MAIIAIAGGTSPTLGRAIVTAVLKSGKNTPIVLSRVRGQSSGQRDEIYGAQIRYVDYTSQESTVAALKDVETVVSVLKIPGPEWSEYHINLLNAAKVAGVKRFVPAEWEAGPLASGMVDIMAGKPVVWKACEESGLECARFCCGMFMNYLAIGSGRDDLLHGLVDKPMIWNVAKHKAELPVKEDGTFPLA